MGYARAVLKVVASPITALEVLIRSDWNSLGAIGRIEVVQKVARA